VLQKVNQGFRNTVNNATMVADRRELFDEPADLRAADDDVGYPSRAYLDSVAGRRSRLSDCGLADSYRDPVTRCCSRIDTAFGNSHPILNWWCYKIPRYGSIAWG
jgi:hypothetical protein